MSLELYKYAVMQLLVLAASLDEDLARSGHGVLPVSFPKSVTPTNLVELTADAAARLSGATLASSIPTGESGIVQPEIPTSVLPTGLENLPAPTGLAAGAALSPPAAPPVVVPGSSAGSTIPTSSTATPMAPGHGAIVPPAVPLESHVRHRRDVGSFFSARNLSRNRRDIRGAVSEVADSVAKVSRTVADHEASPNFVRHAANKLHSASMRLEDRTKTDATRLGEYFIRIAA